MKGEPPSSPFELQAASYLAKNSLVTVWLIRETAVWSSDDDSAVPNSECSVIAGNGGDRVAKSATSITSPGSESLDHG